MTNGKKSKTAKHGRLSTILSSKEKWHEESFTIDDEKSLASLQLKMLRIQQGIWHSKKRAIIVFEGFDAAGKGGAIKKITENLDPRSCHVNPIGPPTESEQGRHYLYRFWAKLPEPGMIAIFDRSWYGRVLVERVKGLTPEHRWREAYAEINQFESMLIHDGIEVIKIFLAIHPEEQLKRFEARLRDPYKQWKLTLDDLESNGQWNHYVKAADEMLSQTHHKINPWNLIPADSKDHARHETLRIITKQLSHHGKWIEDLAQKRNHRQLKQELLQLKKARSHLKHK